MKRITVKCFFSFTFLSILFFLCLQPNIGFDSSSEKFPTSTNQTLNEGQRNDAHPINTIICEELVENEEEGKDDFTFCFDSFNPVENSVLLMSANFLGGFSSSLFTHLKLFLKYSYTYFVRSIRI